VPISNAPRSAAIAESASMESVTANLDGLVRIAPLNFVRSVSTGTVTMERACASLAFLDQTAVSVNVRMAVGDMVPASKGDVIAVLVTAASPVISKSARMIAATTATVIRGRSSVSVLLGSRVQTAV